MVEVAVHVPADLRLLPLHGINMEIVGCASRQSGESSTPIGITSALKSGLPTEKLVCMHRQPDGTPAPLNDLQASKWWLAIDAVEALSASYGGGIRFGLELFPLDPGGVDGKNCVTLEERMYVVISPRTPWDSFLLRLTVRDVA